MTSPMLIPATFTLVLTLTACGGGDPVASTPNLSSSGISCDNTGTRSTRTGYRDATAAELSSFAATYSNLTVTPSSGSATSATFVFNADGSASYKGVAQTIQSLCYRPADSALDVEWSKSAGAGIYLNLLSIYSVRKQVGGIVNGDLIQGSF